MTRAALDTLPLAGEGRRFVFVASWANGFGWTNPRGGWEYPMFWGLIVLAIGLRGGGPYSLDRRLGREL